MKRNEDFTVITVHNYYRPYRCDVREKIQNRAINSVAISFQKLERDGLLKSAQNTEEFLR